MFEAQHQPYQSIAEKFSAQVCWLRDLLDNKIPRADYVRGVIDYNYDMMLAERARTLADSRKLIGQLESTVQRGCQLDSAWYEGATELAESLRHRLYAIKQRAEAIDRIAPAQNEKPAGGHEK